MIQNHIPFRASVAASVARAVTKMNLLLSAGALAGVPVRRQWEVCKHRKIAFRPRLYDVRVEDTVAP